jgi:hypothetical protein
MASAPTRLKARAMSDPITMLTMASRIASNTRVETNDAASARFFLCVRK